MRISGNEERELLGMGMRRVSCWECELELLRMGSRRERELLEMRMREGTRCTCTMKHALSLCREQVASLALLADMTAQAKAIEIMISHVCQVSMYMRTYMYMYIYAW